MTGLDSGITRNPRVLIAGVGNVLRGDDGFGPAALRAVEASGCLSDDVHGHEFGIGGVGIVHELLAGYDALVVLDAVDRGGDPGSLYVLEPQVRDLEGMTDRQRHDLSGDMHEALPAQILLMARAMNALPPVVRIIGCQPGETEELTLELSAAVQQALPAAVAAVIEFLDSIYCTRP